MGHLCHGYVSHNQRVTGGHHPVEILMMTDDDSHHPWWQWCLGMFYHWGFTGSWFTHVYNGLQRDLYLDTDVWKNIMCMTCSDFRNLHFTCINGFGFVFLDFHFGRFILIMIIFWWSNCHKLATPLKSAQQTPIEQCWQPLLVDILYGIYGININYIRYIISTN